ncbi:polymerase [Streptococcus orisratti]
MKIRINKDISKDWLVYFGVFLYIAVYLLGTTFYAKFIPASIKHIASLFSIFLLILYKFIVVREDTKLFKASFTFVILALLVILSTGSFQDYIYSLVIIFLLKDFDFNKLTKFITPVMILLLAFIILSSKLGLIQDYTEVTLTRVRHYLGFRYSLLPSTVMLNIVALYLFNKKENIRYRELLLLGVVAWWIFLQTNSRLTAISSILLIVFGFIYKLWPNILQRVRYLLLLLVPSYIYCAILSYLVAEKYTFLTNWILSLNKFLGGRIYLASKSLSMYSFGLLGKNIQWVGNGLGVDGRRNTMTYLYVDNMYIQVLQKYGLIFLVIFIMLMTIAMVMLYSRQQYFLLLTLILLAFHAVIDDLTFNLHFNLFLIMLGLPFSSTLTKISGNKIHPNLNNNIV